MKTLLAALVSSLAALAVQPVVLFSWALLPPMAQGAELPWDQVGFMLLMAVVFAVPFVVLLGIPLTLLLQRIGYLKWWCLAAVGALAGAIFAGWSGPGGDPGFSSGGNWYGRSVDFVVNGKPTLYGWLSYVQSVAAFAFHGLAGATAFFIVWVRRMGPNNSFKPMPLRDTA
jgi:hypothetical protein